MAENRRARDLAVRNFATVDRHDPLATALNALMELQARDDMPNALVVQDVDGEYVGVLSARRLVRILASRWMESEPGPAPGADGGGQAETVGAQDEAVLEAQLLAAVAEAAQVPVGEFVPKDLPAVGPETRLLELIRTTCAHRLEFIPVVENGRAFGLVPLTAIFQATASLALTPEDEGIRFDP